MSERPAFYRPIPVRVAMDLWRVFGFPIGLAVGMVIATGADLAGVKRDHEALHRANLTIACQESALLQGTGIVFVSIPQYREAVARQDKDREACRQLEAIRAEEDKAAAKEAKRGR